MAKKKSSEKKYETVKLDGEKVRFRKGALHRQLKVPEDEDIGNANLRKIKAAKVGSKIKIKGNTFTVTELMKKRANLGLNLQGKG
mgnify:CR=1 FL=1